MRLRNMEQLHLKQQATNTGPSVVESHTAADAVAGAAKQASGGSHDADQVSLTSSDGRTGHSDDTPRASGEDTRVSNFEELLHRSRVYRHAGPEDGTPSLISDARSTLALSICSSFTLGEVSNISVYAIPIYAHELSNASCYRFDQSATSENPSSSRDEPASKVLSTPEKRQWRLLFKRSSRRDKADVVPAAPDGVFGVPLVLSIRYANVALSLWDEKGEKYIYGYTPIIVAKCGVFLKEKGRIIEPLRISNMSLLLLILSL